MAEAIRVIAILELATGVGLILFWVGWTSATIFRTAYIRSLKAT